MLEHVGVKLLLDALRLGVELMPKVFSGHSVIDWVVVPESLDPSHPSYSRCWFIGTDVVESYPMILGM